MAAGCGANGALATKTRTDDSARMEPRLPTPSAAAPPTPPPPLPPLPHAVPERPVLAPARVCVGAYEYAYAYECAVLRCGLPACNLGKPDPVSSPGRPGVARRQLVASLCLTAARRLPDLLPCQICDVDCSGDASLKSRMLNTGGP